jgi:hypothetical protein
MPTIHIGTSESAYTSAILTFEPERTLRMADRLRHGGVVTQAFSLSDWRLDQREVLLLSLQSDSPSIDGMILLERMRGNGGTETIKMRVIDHVLFEPVGAGDVARILPLSSSISHLDKQILLEPETWERLITRLVHLRPEAANAILRMLKNRSAEPPPMDSSLRNERLLEQVDAIGLAVEIGGGERAGILRQTDLDRRGEARSAVDLFVNIPFYETDFINHDTWVFGQLLNASYRTMVFGGDRGSRIIVRVLDHTPLESAFGTDLLIYQQRYESVLLLQYKTMRQDGNDMIYRANSQLDKQLAAMDVLERAIARIAVTDNHAMQQWRLHHGMAYIKFCEQVSLHCSDGKLVPGMILAAEHLRGFLEGGMARGVRGGRIVSRNYCPRHLSNTQFTDLASNGWIGCTDQGAAALDRITHELRSRELPAILAEIIT